MNKRTDWKALHSEEAKRADSLENALHRQDAEIEQLRADLQEREREIEALKQAVQRARLEGAKATTESLLALADH